jgi:hypothetical protein
MDFLSLQHIRPGRSTHRGFCLPATFRLQGLATLLTVFSLPGLASLVSCRQRSWDSPFEAFPSRKVPPPFPAALTRLPFLPALRHPPEGEGRCAEPRFPGFVPSESPLRPHLGVAGRCAGCSLGIHPPRVLHQTACQGFRPGSSHTLCGDDLAEPAGVPEYRSLSD